MQNDFEKDITRRMQEFSIAPQPEIWLQVEAALPPEKKRRIALWWWLLPLAVLLSAGFWMMTGNHPQSIVQEPTVQKSIDTGVHQLSTASQTETPQQQQVATRDDTAVRHSFTHTKNTRQRKTTITYTTEKDTAFTTNQLVFSSKRHAGKKFLSGKNELPNRTYKATENEDSILFYPGKKKSTPKDTSTYRYSFNKQRNQSSGEAVVLAGNQQTPGADTLPAKALPDTTALLTASKMTTAPVADTTQKAADTAALHQPKEDKSVVVAKKKSALWIAEAGFGLSGQYQPANSNTYLSSSNYSASPTPGLPGRISSSYLPKSSFSFSLGVVRKKMITQHWNWQVGLRYQLLSTTQAYGSLRNSSANFSLADASRVYYLGDTSVYHNYVHQVQIAPKIEYVLNTKSALPISFNVGLSVAYNARSNQLLYDSRNGYYLLSPAYTTKWLYAAELGAGVFISKKLYAGLTYQHGLSNVAKPALQSDFRWRVWQVRLGLPLFNHSSK